MHPIPPSTCSTIIAQSTSPENRDIVLGFSSTLCNNRTVQIVGRVWLGGGIETVYIYIYYNGTLAL